MHGRRWLFDDTDLSLLTRRWCIQKLDARRDYLGTLPLAAAVLGFVRIATTRAQFAHFPEECLKPETRWRSEVNSNCRYRFLNCHPTATESSMLSILRRNARKCRVRGAAASESSGLFDSTKRPSLAALPAPAFREYFGPNEADPSVLATM